MKLLLLALLSTSLFARVYFNEDLNINAKTTCVDGYKYLIVISGQGAGVVQMYKAGAELTNHPSQPIKCKAKK